MKKIVSFLALAGVSVAAQAHTGHGTASLMEGLAHPVAGFDHLLAMAAVGLWSARSFTGTSRLVAPAAFLATMVAGAAVASGTGMALMGMETLIAASVLVLGGMLFAPKLAKSLGLALVGVAGLAHGWAHGLEAAGSQFALYAAGFVTMTAMAHGLGVAVGSRLVRWNSQVQWRVVAASIAAYGAYSMTALA